MANFYTDNEDIQFLFKHTDLGELAGVCEEGFRFAAGQKMWTAMGTR